MALNGKHSLLPSNARPWVKEAEKKIVNHDTQIAALKAQIIALQKLVK